MLCQYFSSFTILSMTFPMTHADKGKDVNKMSYHFLNEPKHITESTVPLMLYLLL